MSCSRLKRKRALVSSRGFKLNPSLSSACQWRTPLHCAPSKRHVTSTMLKAGRPSTALSTAFKCTKGLVKATFPASRNNTLRSHRLHRPQHRCYRRLSSHPPCAARPTPLPQPSWRRCQRCQPQHGKHQRSRLSIRRNHSRRNPSSRPWPPPVSPPRQPFRRRPPRGHPQCLLCVYSAQVTAIPASPIRCLLQLHSL